MTGHFRDELDEVEDGEHDGLGEHNIHLHHGVRPNQGVLHQPL